MICEWLSMRDKAPIPEWALPVAGVIVPNVACGFLISMSNHCAMLDFFVSNPVALRSKRREAFDEIMTELLLSAKEAGIKMVFATSNIKSTSDLALKHGLIADGVFTSFKKEL